MNVRIMRGAFVKAVAFFVLCVGVPFGIWFSCKAARTANRAADAFTQENPVFWGNLALESPFKRTYTVFTVFKSTSYCSIVDGDIVEAMTNGRDIFGKTSPIDVCFSGWWWQKKTSRGIHHRY